jgi:hypothetical protein
MSVIWVVHRNGYTTTYRDVKAYSFGPYGLRIRFANGQTEMVSCDDVKCVESAMLAVSEYRPRVRLKVGYPYTLPDCRYVFASGTTGAGPNAYTFNVMIGKRREVGTGV